MCSTVTTQVRATITALAGPWRSCRRRRSPRQPPRSARRPRARPPAARVRSGLGTRKRRRPPGCGCGARSPGRRRRQPLRRASSSPARRVPTPRVVAWSPRGPGVAVVAVPTAPIMSWENRRLESSVMHNAEKPPAPASRTVVQSPRRSATAVSARRSASAPSEPAAPAWARRQSAAASACCAGERPCGAGVQLAKAASPPDTAGTATTAAAVATATAPASTRRRAGAGRRPGRTARESGRSRSVARMARRSASARSPAGASWGSATSRDFRRAVSSWDRFMARRSSRGGWVWRAGGPGAAAGPDGHG